MKKNRILSGMMAVTLVFLQVLTAVFSFPMHVSAGEMLGENDFDSGKGLPWHICESATAKMGLPVPSQRTDHRLRTYLSCTL